MSKVVTNLKKFPSAPDRLTSYGRYGYTNMRLELIRARADLLNPRDRMLVKMYIVSGSTFGQIARIKGLSEGAVARRIRKLISKLLDGSYIRCIRHKQHFTDLQLAIAKDYLLEDKSLNSIARKHALSRYRIRKEIRYILDFVNTT